MILKELRESGVSSVTVSSNPCSVQNIAYPKILFILLDSLKVTLSMDTLKLTESYLISEKTEHKLVCYNSPHIKISGVSCNVYQCLG